MLREGGASAQCSTFRKPCCSGALQGRLVSLDAELRSKDARLSSMRQEHDGKVATLEDTILQVGQRRQTRGVLDDAHLPASVVVTW